MTSLFEAQRSRIFAIDWSAPVIGRQSHWVLLVEHYRRLQVASEQLQLTFADYPGDPFPGLSPAVPYSEEALYLGLDPIHSALFARIPDHRRTRCGLVACMRHLYWTAAVEDEPERFGTLAAPWEPLMVLFETQGTIWHEMFLVHVDNTSILSCFPRTNRIVSRPQISERALKLYDEDPRLTAALSKGDLRAFDSALSTLSI